MNVLSKTCLLSLISWMLFSSTVLSAVYTSPSYNEFRIFYITRSKNQNIVCYDARFKSNGQIDTSEPVHAYWINQTDKPGEKSDLSYIQNKLAYGYSSSINNKNEIEISLVAFPDRKLRIHSAGPGKAEGRMRINGTEAVLNRIHVEADPSNSLRVLYVDLFGQNPENGKAITERIYNK